MMHTSNVDAAPIACMGIAAGNRHPATATPISIRRMSGYCDTIDILTRLLMKRMTKKTTMRQPKNPRVYQSGNA